MYVIIKVMVKPKGYCLLLNRYRRGNLATIFVAMGKNALFYNLNINTELAFIVVPSKEYEHLKISLTWFPWV